MDRMSRTRGWRLTGSAALALVFLMYPMAGAHATKVAVVGLEEMVAGADRIFAGSCLEARGELDAGRGIVTTRYTFSVARVVKGTVGSILQFRQYGGSAGKRHSAISGLPVYRPGEEFVLFLKPDGQWGLTSPVGLFQGRYGVAVDPETGRKAVCSDAYAPHLSGSVLAAKARGLGKPARISRSGGMDLEDFLGLVEGMVKDGR